MSLLESIKKYIKKITWKVVLKYIVFILLLITASNSLMYYWTVDLSEERVPPIFLLLLIMTSLLVLGIDNKTEVITDIKRIISEPPIKVYGANDEADNDLKNYVDEVKPEKVHMVEYSSECVKYLIKHLIKTRTSPEIRLLIQHPDEVKSISGQPGRIWGVIIGTYYQEKEIRDYRNLKILCYKQRTSFRGRNFDDKLINIGWYIYTHEDNKQEVYGHNQPVITFREGYEGFSDIKRMFNYTFDNLWEHGISLDEVYEEFKSQLSLYNTTKFLEWCDDVTPEHKKEGRESETTR